MEATEAVITLIKSELKGEEISEDVKRELTPALISRVYALAKAHDVANIVADALSRENIQAGDDVSNKLVAEQYKAAIRVARLGYDLTVAVDALEEAGIYNIPLKGSVLRSYYPRPEMRTSCDIDILVHESDLNAAISALVERGGLTRGERWTHDVSLFFEDEMHLELHFAAFPEHEKIEKPLNDVWDLCLPAEGRRYRLVMPPERFVYYHVAHMAKHFLSSGFGIRSIIDLYVIETRFEFDREELSRLLKIGGLTDFYAAAKRLAEVWFDGEECDEKTALFSEHIFCCGVYGTTKTRVAVSGNEGGKGKYVFKRIFPSFRRMALQYPVLNKCPILLPIFYIVRIFRMIFRGDLKKSRTELNEIKKLSGDKSKMVMDLKKYLGLE